MEGYEGIAHTLSALGLALRGRDDHEAAAKVYKESLIVSSQIGFRWTMIEGLIGFAALGVSGEKRERAVRLLAAADALQKTTEHILPFADQAEFDQMVDLLREKLGEEALPRPGNRERVCRQIRASSMRSKRTNDGVYRFLERVDRKLSYSALHPQIFLEPRRHFSLRRIRSVDIKG